MPPGSTSHSPTSRPSDDTPSSFRRWELFPSPLEEEFCDHTAKIDQQEGPLGDLYLRLRNEVAADASLLSLSYPHLMPTSLLPCAKLVNFSQNEREFFRDGVDRLDDVIARASHDAGVHHFDLRPVFADHQVCSDQGEWINGMARIKNESFHPNSAGHAGTAARLSRWLDELVGSGVPLNDAGLPISPQPGLSLFAAASAASQIPPGEVPAEFDTLSIADTSIDPTCVNAFSPGETVVISGDGFAPGGPVQVNLLAPDREDVDLGVVNADSQGILGTTVVIPETYLPAEFAALQAVGGTTGNAAVRVLNDLITVVDEDDPCAGSAEFQFDGFYAPVDNPPVVNVVQAGLAVPVKFSLGGDEGLDIFAAGYPSSYARACDTDDPISDVEQTVSPGAATLTYDAATDRYTYVWKTSKQWSGCRTLMVRFRDGSTYTALFQFR